MLRYWIDVYAETHPGRRRPKNEDGFLLVDLPGGEWVDTDDGHAAGRRWRGGPGRSLVFAVADGMGGAGNGELASRLALQTVANVLRNGNRTGIDLAARLAAAVGSANRVIYEFAEAEPERTGMGTTFTALGLRGSQACWTQVGDSRLYLFREGKLRCLTRDQTVVQAQIDAGKITRGESLRSPLRHLLTHALGPEPMVETQTGRLEVRNNDILFLATDGVTGPLRHWWIRDKLSMRNVHPDRIGRGLIDDCLEQGGPDNATIQIVRIQEE
jgi:PPM family protein phosphatase